MSLLQGSQYTQLLNRVMSGKDTASLDTGAVPASFARQRRGIHFEANLPYLPPDC